MDIRLSNLTTKNKTPRDVSLSCPHCKHINVTVAIADDQTFDLRPETVDKFSTSKAKVAQGAAGLRICANTDCHGLIFWATAGRTRYIYPHVKVDINSSGLPQPILSAFEEAVDCHAHGSYVAAGLMIRKTLEEVCEDQNAQGQNLKARIADLRNSVLLPQRLFDGIDHLRLLGNDAAHVQSGVFSEVGQREVDAALRFSKEFLKAVYQYEGLVKELEGLQTEGTDSDPMDR